MTVSGLLFRRTISAATGKAISASASGDRTSYTHQHASKADSGKKAGSERLVVMILSQSIIHYMYSISKASVLEGYSYKK